MPSTEIWRVRIPLALCAIVVAYEHGMGDLVEASERRAYLGQIAKCSPLFCSEVAFR